MGANFEFSLKTIKDRLGVNAKAIEWPIGAEDQFKGQIDLIEMKAYLYDGGADENYTEIEIPADLADIAQEKRELLIDTLAQFDDELAMLYLEGEEIPAEMI